MRYISLFAGMGGFDLGLEQAGHECVAQVEIDRNCNKVLSQHWPNVERWSDVTETKGDQLPAADLVCGGFPCTDVSVAGNRAGLAGKQSGLWWQFHRILSEKRPAWCLIENVPGLLSSNGGRDMGAILWALGDLGYGWAYRVLDSQWFGLAQRRERVFIVGHLGDRRGAAEVLFEPEGGGRDTPPSREAGAQVAGTVMGGPDKPSSHGKESGSDRRVIAYPLTAHEHRDGDCDTNYVVANTLQGHHNRGQHEMTYVTHALTSEGADASEDGSGRGTPIVAIRLAQTGSNGWGVDDSGVAYTLDEAQGQAVCFQQNQRNEVRQVNDDGAIAGALSSQAGMKQQNYLAVASGRFGVRRLTPLECLRLQGFPDDWLDGLSLSDSAKYRMAGNAVSVPVAEWIGKRLLQAAR